MMQKKGSGNTSNASNETRAANPATTPANGATNTATTPVNSTTNTATSDTYI